jgi:predicted nucleic acid-binding protein
MIIEEELLPFVTTVQVNSRISHIKNDPEDDKFLSLAIDGKVDYIFSGDKHLLNLKEYKAVKIVTIIKTLRPHHS